MGNFLKVKLATQQYYLTRYGKFSWNWITIDSALMGTTDMSLQDMLNLGWEESHPKGPLRILISLQIPKRVQINDPSLDWSTPWSLRNCEVFCLCILQRFCKAAEVFNERPTFWWNFGILKWKLSKTQFSVSTALQLCLRPCNVTQRCYDLSLQRGGVFAEF